MTTAMPNRLRPKTKLPHKCGSLAGATRFEHATDGFGDRNSTVELRPFALISYHLSADKSIIFGVFMKNKIKIAFIGCGKLARAMIESMTNRASVSVLKSNGYVFSITASSRGEASLMPVKHLCSTTLDNAAACDQADYVILAVKPQNVGDALGGLDLKRKVVISVMAGVPVSELKRLTGSGKIVRVMPNLCAAAGESFNPYYAEGLSSDEEQVVLQILGSFGTFCKTDERALDVAAVVSGGGPAYVAMLIRAFETAAVSGGIDPALARDMAVQTTLGSALLYERMSGAQEVIDAVCSKGGMTERGVKYLEEHDFDGLFKGAFNAAHDRVSEMNDEKR